MTTTELEAGRELDLLVGQRIMGWPYAGVFVGDGPLVETPNGPVATCPRYSTNIAAAWQIVERMSELGFHARVKSPFEPGQPYFAGFTPHGMSGWNGRPDHEGSGDTAPLAICRAALRAAGGA